MYNSTPIRNKAIEKRKKSMLYKLRGGKPKPLGEIDEFGSEDSQAFAELICEDKVEVVSVDAPLKIGNETYTISKLMAKLKKQKLVTKP
jgi:hypothetical protein